MNQFKTTIFLLIFITLLSPYNFFGAKVKAFPSNSTTLHSTSMKPQNQEKVKNLFESETFKVIAAVIVVVGLIFAVMRFAIGIVTKKEVQDLISEEQERLHEKIILWNTTNCKIIDFQIKGFEKIFNILLRSLKEEKKFDETEERVKKGYKQFMLENEKFRFISYVQSNDPDLINLGLNGIGGLADVGAIPVLDRFIQDYKNDEHFKDLVEMAREIRDRIIRIYK